MILGYCISSFTPANPLDWIEPYQATDISISTYGLFGFGFQAEQFFQSCPEIADPKREFIIELTSIQKEDQPKSGGFRWVKWGPIVDPNLKPKADYLYDEPDIGEVVAYSIYERKRNKDNLLRLRIFSYHIACICSMNDGDVSDFYPLGADIRITVAKENGLFKVNGESVGNIWGAKKRYAEIVQANAVGIHPDNDSEKDK